jgi:hypothetical protein
VNRHSGMLLAVFGKKALLTVNMLACLYLLKVPVEVKKLPLWTVFRPLPITASSSFLLGTLQDSKVR